MGISVAHPEEFILGIVENRRLMEKYAANVSVDDSISSEHVNTPCWPWTGKLAKGYGMLGVPGESKGIRVQAHRISWAAEHGYVPRLFICHRCDNSRCVNPDHLFPGSPRDNVADMVYKSRQAKGSRNNLHKLTESEVIDMRKLRSSGKTYKAIGALYGVRATAELPTVQEESK